MICECVRIVSLFLSSIVLVEVRHLLFVVLNSLGWRFGILALKNVVYTSDNEILNSVVGGETKPQHSRTNSLQMEKKEKKIRKKD